MRIDPPKYKSKTSVGQAKPIYIDHTDKRLSKLNYGKTVARAGAPVIAVDMSSKSLVTMSSDASASLTLPGATNSNSPLTFNQIAGVLNPSGTVGSAGSSGLGGIDVIQNPNAPDAVTNLQAVWVGSTLVITFDFDTSATENYFIKDFLITFTPNGGTAQSIYMATINTTSVHQTYNFTITANAALFGVYQTNFSALSVISQDMFQNQSAATTIVPPIWSNGLPTPHIYVSNITNGYSVTTTYLDSNSLPVLPAVLPTSTNFNYVDIEEYVDSSSPPSINIGSNDPTNLPSSLFTGKPFQQVSLSSLNPVNIYTPTTAPRYVRAKFTDVMGSGAGSYSNIVKASPSPVVSVNTTPPTDVLNTFGSFISGVPVNVTAASSNGTTITYTATNTFTVGQNITILGLSTSTFNLQNVTVASATSSQFTVTNSATGTAVTGATGIAFVAGTGDDVLIAATLPTDGNAGNSFIVKLMPKDAPTLSGSFYFYPTATTSPQIFIVNSSDIYAQLGSFYADYTGYIISVSSVGNQSAHGGTAIPEFTRINSLAGVTPTFSVVPAANGYIVTWSNISGATYSDIYESATSFVLPQVSTFSSTGSGSNAIATFVFASSVASLLSVGQDFSIKNAIPSQFNNEFITVSVNSNTVTATPILAKGATFTATSSTSGTGIIAEFNPIDETSRVYAGSSPTTIQSLNYSTRYIKIRNYDNYDETSNFAFQQLVTPYDPGLLSLINNPVTFQTNGSIYAGSYDVTKTPDPSGATAHAIFNKTGLYVYDSNGKPTTQIIGDPAAIYDPTSSTGAKLPNTGITFLTQNAHIADWNISASSIENTLSGGTGGSGTYTGLSGTGSYAFWAGSPTQGGSLSAKFYVTPSGAVVASNIQINGGTLDIGSTSSNLTTGFHVTSAGIMYAKGAIIGGTLEVDDGSTFKGNVQVLTGASLYAGDLTKANLAISSTGLSAFASDGKTQLTGIATNPGTGPSFTTSSALIGDWSVSTSTIISGNTGITLDAANDQIVISGPLTAKTGGGYLNNDTYELVLASPSAATSNDGTGIVLKAGPKGATPNFAVTSAGNLTAQNASISGTISASGPIVASGNNYRILLDPNNQYISFATGLGNSSGTSATYTTKGLMYTRGNYTIMQPGSTVAFAAGSSTGNFNLDSSSEYIIAGTPALVMSQSTNTLVLGTSITTAQQQANGYTAGGKTYYPPLNQYIKFGPSGMAITTLPYVGDLSATIGSGAATGNQFPTVNSDPFVRMIIQSPYLADGGQMKTGPAIYYFNGNSPVGSSGTTGLIGDIWLEY